VSVLNWFRRPAPANPARDLAAIGHRQRREAVKAKTRLIREQLGLPPLSILNHEGN
jgi:hypothetical protein